MADPGANVPVDIDVDPVEGFEILKIAVENVLERDGELHRSEVAGEVVNELTNRGKMYERKTGYAFVPENVRERFGFLCKEEFDLQDKNSGSNQSYYKGKADKGVKKIEAEVAKRVKRSNDEVTACTNEMRALAERFQEVKKRKGELKEEIAQCKRSGEEWSAKCVEDFHFGASVVKKAFKIDRIFLEDASSFAHRPDGRRSRPI